MRDAERVEAAHKRLRGTDRPTSSPANRANRDASIGSIPETMELGKV